MRRCPGCNRRRPDNCFDESDLCSICLKIKTRPKRVIVRSRFSSNDPPKMNEIVNCEACGEEMMIGELRQHIRNRCKIFLRLRSRRIKHGQVI